MYARIATFEGATAIDETVKEIQSSDRPDDLPAKEMFLLADRAAGKVIALTLFETEEDMQQGNKVMDAMSAPGGGFGNRVSVDLLEVAAHMTA